MNFTKNEIAAYPETADVRIPIQKKGVVRFSKTYPIFRIPAPKIMGMDKRKENFAALDRLNPKKRAMVMVIPEREVPGMRATACMVPMALACHHERSIKVR